MAIGASVGGLLADRFGRRQVFAVTLLVYGLATGASALVGGLAALLVLRFLVGLGLGAELPVASTYVSEFAPARMRGRLIVILEAFWAVGWTAAALIGFLVIPDQTTAGAGPSPSARSRPRTRWSCGGACPSPHGGSHAAVGTPRRTPSSRSFEAGRRGRGSLRSADAARRRMRRRGAVRRGQRLARAVGARSSGCAPRACGWCGSASTSRTTAPSSGSRRSSSSQGYDLVRSFGFTLIITLAQLPGYAVAAWLIEVWGRRLTLSVFLVGLGGRGDLLRHGDGRVRGHRHRHGAVVLQPRRVGSAVRRHPRDVPDLAARDRLGLGGGRRAHRLDRRPAHRAAAARGSAARRSCSSSSPRSSPSPPARRGAWSTAEGARSTTAEPRRRRGGRGIRSLRRDRRLVHRRRRRRPSRRPRAGLGGSRRAGLGGRASDEPIEYANLAIRGKLAWPIVDEQLEPALALKPTHLSFNGGGNDMIRPRTIDLARRRGLHPCDRALRRGGRAAASCCPARTRRAQLPLGRRHPAPRRPALARRRTRGSPIAPTSSARSTGPTASCRRRRTGRRTGST